MSEVVFFVESKKSDAKFLIDFIEERFGIKFYTNDFIELGSWSGYKNEVKKYTELYTDKVQITILDADNSFKDRKKEVESDFEKLGIESNLFLFPNNCEDGNLENILATIASRQDLINCFQAYEECVKLFPKKLNDARIYSYLDMLLHPNPLQSNLDLRKDENRDYRNKEHWNLNNDYLDALHNFLSPFLIYNSK
jgi:hypothetical protein